MTVHSKPCTGTSSLFGTTVKGTAGAAVFDCQCRRGAMLRQKSFVKVTRGGGVAKVVREHYLRDDIPCGVEGCLECLRLMEALSEAPILLNPSLQTVANSAIGKAHIILPDTNILLHHLDVLETALFQDIVVLQTVLEEVKSNSLAIYRRVRALVSQPAKRLFVFSNENHRQTFIEKASGESDNDRNDRSIRQAAAWYQQHLRGQPELVDYAVVLLTNDVANARLATEAGIRALRLRDYVLGFRGAHANGLDTLIMDMLESAKEEQALDKHGSGECYPEYLSPGVLQAAVQAGKLFQGSLQVSAYNRDVASITNNGTTVKIVGREAINRALPGDTVVVELLPPEQWAAKDRADLLPKEQDQDGEETSTDTKSDELIMLPAVESIPKDPQDVAADGTSDRTPCGKVVGVVRRSARTYCGSIDRKTIRPDAGSQAVLVIPLDRRMPRVRIRTSNATSLATQRIVVAIDGWERTSRNPHGHLVRVLGVAGERSTETQVILLEHDVAHQDFTPQVLACLPASDWAPTLQDYEERVDLRHLDICSVDPPGCTDIDDALHARPLPNGNVEVGVHIADVTHFVKADTPLDREASQRSTTVYLVDRRIDMLPGLLGTNLCSLKSHVERFAFSCVWELTPEAQIVSTRFHKSIISSKASFTYDQAQARLDDPSAEDALSTSLKLLSRLAKQLKARRIEAGALTLASPEVRFTLDTDTQNPVDVELKEMKDANSMVEEFMLLANISVATRIQHVFPDTAVLRRHPAPPPENFVALNRALQEREQPPLDVSSSKALAESLDRVGIQDDPFFNRLVRIMATRCMYQAQYFAAGSHGYEAYWHYGLACPIYTHFTSPIRRYADVLVHRLLAAATEATRYGLSGIALADRPKLEEICNNMNYRHRMAQQAQRASIELYTHLFFRGKTVNEAAYVVKLMPNGLVALIPQYGIEGLIRWEEEQLKKAGFHFDPETSRLICLTSGRPIMSLFEKISIALSVEENEASQRQKLVVKLVEPSLEGISAARSEPVAAATPSPPTAGIKRPIDDNAP